MRKAHVFYNQKEVGILTEHHRKHYEFRYNDACFYNDQIPAISLTMPKTQQVYEADHLFPFFFNMLSEGDNKALQCRLLNIDKEDYFGLLVETANYETIGAITVRPFEEVQSI